MKYIYVEDLATPYGCKLVPIDGTMNVHFEKGRQAYLYIGGYAVCRLEGTCADIIKRIYENLLHNDICSITVNSSN